MCLLIKVLVDWIYEKNFKIYVYVDGVQVWGLFNYDFIVMDCDSYSVGSYKWFLGFKEIGLLYMKEKCIFNFVFKDIGYDGEMQFLFMFQDNFYGIEFLIKDVFKFELVGQCNDINIIGLLYIVDLLGLIGF